MKFIPVVSSMIAAVKYDVATGRLVVQFGPDSFYEYENIPTSIVVQFLFADSLGAAFTKLVKQGHFIYRKITPEQAHA
jgi:hypothetical protein